MNLTRSLLMIAVLIFSASSGHARTLDDLQAGGVLTCGVASDHPGFSMRDNAYRWSGFDVEICRALAIATIGDGSKVNFVALAEDEMAVALQSGEIDVLARGVQWDFKEDTTRGLIFVTPTFLAEKPNKDLAVFGPMVRQGDDQWLQVVRWTVYALLQAEVLGITQANVAENLNASNSKQSHFLHATQSPDLLGLDLQTDWPAKIIAGTGNYGEIFERYFGAESQFKQPRAHNRLWRDGGAMIVPTFD